MNQLIAFLARRRKAVQAFIGAELTWAATSIVPDGHVNRWEWYAQAVVLAAVMGVHQVSNDSKEG